jgi:zinc transport system substrate-binding protein
MKDISLFVRKRVLFVFCALVFLFGQNHTAAAEKMNVVTSIFPLYDFARQVGGDLIDVSLMLPPGVEAHGFSPTPNNMIAVKRADLFLYTSDILEPWAGTIVAAVGVKNGKVVEVGKEIISDDTHQAGHDDKHRGLDPHIWLDPALAMKMVEVIEAALSEVDSANSAVYKNNGAEYIGRLYQFDEQTKHILQNCKLQTIVSGGHFAFGAFARRYGLSAVSPFQGFSPDAQPSPKAIGRLIKTVRETGSKVIFHEELIQPKVARIIAEETGARLLLLHGVHNVSKRELERGETYLSLMQMNVDNLKQGLQCQ